MAILMYENNKKIDIGKHIFYTSWAVILINGLLMGLSIILSDYLYLFAISYDVILAILAWGIFRLRELQAKKSSIYTIVGLIGYASIIDLLQAILSKTVSDLAWNAPLLSGLRLFLIISHLCALSAAFILLKLTYDDLYDKQVSKKRMNWFIAIGYFLLLFPYIVSWYADVNADWVGYATFNYLAMFVYLVSIVLIMLGFVDLAMILLIKGSKEEYEDNDYLTEEQV